MFPTLAMTAAAASLRRLRSVARFAPALFLIAGALPALAQTQSAPSAPVRVPSRITAGVDENARVTLAGTVLPRLRHAADQGMLPDSTPLTRVQILLTRSEAQEASLHQLLDDLHNPGSPSFHQWLTPEQFGQQFGPADADVAAISTWLAGKGFTVGKLNPGRQTLEFEGTAGQFRGAFHTELHKFLAAGGTHIANTADPQIPAALAPVFGGFVSLNNFPPHSPIQRKGSAAYNPRTGQAKGNWTVGSPSTGYDFLLAPADFAVQYDLNPLYTAGTNGAGQTIAVINISNVNTYLVNQYRSLFNLPASPLRVIVDGDDPGLNGINSPYGENGFLTEAYLDVEMAGFVAPQANIDLVIASDTALSSGFFLAAENAVYSNIAPVMSLSVGECEQQLRASNQFVNGLWQQAAAQGITVVVSSGDNGSAGCDDFDDQYFAVGGQQVNGFSSTPYNVSVGGTDFYYSAYAQSNAVLNTQIGTYWNFTASNNTPAVSIKGVIPEQAWNDSEYGLDAFNSLAYYGTTNIIAGSGGPSNCGLPTVNGGGMITACAPYPKPAWQTGTGVPADKARDLPDVSLFAANGYNYSYYPICAEDGDCQPVSATGTVQISGAGGTSASAPAFAGIMALVNQKYGRQGQANYTLYPLAAQFPAAFHDITVGTNTVPCNVNSTSYGVAPANCIAVAKPTTETDPFYGSATVGEIGAGTAAEYNAAPGYDLATGLGSIDAAVMLANWNKVSFNSTTTTLTPSATTFAHGTNVTVSGSVKSAGSTTPTGQVAVMTTSTSPNNQAEEAFTLASGSFSGSLNFLPGGSYTVYGRYSGDTSNAASTSTPVALTVTPETSGTALLIEGDTLYGSSVVNSGASNISYGTTLVMEGLPAPAAQLTAYTNCLLQGTACPVFGYPTGSLSFTDGSTALRTVPLAVSGEGVFTWIAPVGAHSVSAAYAGDVSYSASASSATTLTVVKNTPVLGATTSNIGTANNGATVLSFFVENSVAYAPGPAAPTGALTFSGALMPPGMPASVTLTPAIDPGTGAPQGVGTVTLPAGTAAGAYTFNYAYSGDANYNAASQPINVSLYGNSATLLATTTTASVNMAATDPAAPVLLTVAVAGQAGHAAPTGTVALFSDGYEVTDFALPVSTSTTATRTVALSSSGLFHGNNVLTVQYLGDTTYLPSLTTVAVNNPVTDFTLSPASINLSAAANAVTDTITVGSAYGFTGAVALTCTAPTGITCSLSAASVTVPAGGTASASVTLNTSGIASSGMYGVVISGANATGHVVHTLGLTVNVTVAAPSTFTLSAAGSITIPSQGASGSTTVTATASGGFSGAVNLACSVTSSPAGAINLPGCSVTTPVTLPLNGSATATLSITTTPQTRSAVTGLPTAWLAGIGGLAGAAFTLLLTGWVAPRRRRVLRHLQKHSLSLTLALLGAALTGLLGCGGNSSSVSTSGGGTLSGGTTLGTYTVTVTGADAATGKITSSTAVTVVVN